MRALRQASPGLLFVSLTIIIVIGGILTSFSEGGLLRDASNTPTETPVFTPTIWQIDNSVPTQPPQIVTPSQTPSSTATPPADCPPPQGWVTAYIQPGDTLESLAKRYQTSAEQIQKANCLYSDTLLPGTLIYVPFQPQASPTPCRPPAGWVRINIPSGATLYHLSILYRVSVSDLQRANCMGYTTFIRSGQIFYVPNVPTSTATFTVTPTPSQTPTATETPTPSTTPSLTPTASAAPSSTPTPTAPPTSTPTETPTPTESPTPESTPTP